ncbi:hyaluronoglucosaminidase [Teladorsagia circumcincta]|uniref:Hyaluronidase n=1 Tax=Teladorsagia circumcincta TaxID=45464 RepID=A0A2G9TYQ2_TELCI|nr:hyaluronoglucosaminidase [Teladorsagia circumcincta]
MNWSITPELAVEYGVSSFNNVSIVDHLAKVVKDIRKAIPDRNFNGLAVIDLEEWRPLFKMNWGKQTVYQKQSVALVQSKNPGLSSKAALKLAEEEFNRAARIFFVWTLRIARSIRPKAHWGYYDYPFCNSHAGDEPNEYSCNDLAKQLNDE